MAEGDEVAKVKHRLSDPQHISMPFMEVICRSSGKTRRFAAGTEAGFALNLINRKLDCGVPLASHIEAVKEGEEHVSFGINSVLVNYGQGWQLQTVIEPPVKGVRKGECNWTTITHNPSIKGLDGSYSRKKESQPIISLLYVGKILVAFVFMFVLGAIFTITLENLPRLEL